MNLDRHLICGLIYDDNDTQLPDRVRLLLASRHEFSPRNRKVLDFILSHIGDYSKSPDPETVKDTYPAFQFQPNSEPYRYYLDAAIRSRQVTHIMSTMHQVEKDLSADNLEQAIISYTSSAHSFEAVDLKSRDMDVGRDLESYLVEYRKHREEGDFMGIRTGFPTLDDHTFGVHPGEFWVFTGRPGSYKTWLLCYIFSCIISAQDKPVLFFSKEMTREQILMRLIAILTHSSFDTLRRYNAPDELLDRAASIIGALPSRPIIIGRDMRWDYDATYIQSKMLEYQPAIACIDGLYLMAKSAEWGDITQVTRSIRDIALTTEIPIIGTTQSKPKGGAMYADSFEQDSSVLIEVAREFDDVLERRTNHVTFVERKIRDAEDGSKVHVTVGFKTSSFSEGSVDPDEEDWQTEMQK